LRNPLDDERSRDEAQNEDHADDPDGQQELPFTLLAFCRCTRHGLATRPILGPKGLHSSLRGFLFLSFLIRGNRGSLCSPLCSAPGLDLDDLVYDVRSQSGLTAATRGDFGPVQMAAGSAQIAVSVELVTALFAHQPAPVLELVR